jgi:maltooligosyltrehalose synthase
MSPTPRRLSFPIKDILWLTTLLAVLLGWYIHTRNIKEQAIKDIQEVKLLWSNERRDNNDRYQRAMNDYVHNLILTKENKSLKEQVEQLQQQVGK